MYRIDLDGSVTELYGGVGVSNGIGLSPDGSALYHVDSTSRGLWVHDLDAGGAVSNRRHVGRAAFERGIPDGMAVDSDGNLWVAHVAGRRIAKLSPTGELLDELEVPARWVTSCAFGGSDWGDLYVVSADNTDDEALRGCIWRCRPGVKGLPTPPARV
jgi:sugar lactone lactonase YvrE